MRTPIDVKRNPYSQRAIERVIKAAQACGLRIVAVRPDGTVITSDAPPPTPLAVPVGHLVVDWDEELGLPVDARVKLGDFGR